LNDWPENIFGPRTFCDWPMICFHLQKYETLATYVLTTDLTDPHRLYFTYVNVEFSFKKTCDNVESTACKLTEDVPKST
jgi:hypothetical protein